MELKEFSGNQNYRIKIVQQIKGPDIFIEYLVKGQIENLLDTEALAIKPLFKLGLWQSTCFEVFLSDGKQYIEWNFACSGHYSCSLFEGYRRKNSDLKDIAIPEIRLNKSKNQMVLTVMANLAEQFLRGPILHLGLSAVLKEAKETRYFALTHPSKKPDFHATDSFTLPVGSTSSGKTCQAMKG